MWINEVAPERIAELFHNYEHALRVFGKGSESGSWKESEHPERSQMATAADAELESHESASILPSQVKLSGAAKF